MDQSELIFLAQENNDKSGILVFLQVRKPLDRAASKFKLSTFPV